ncbi:MAG: polyprenyl synthetase family protein [Bacteroidales bacterium]|nr:polyprenyl synthetase family protein [Bacteroidales bacterium]
MTQPLSAICQPITEDLQRFETAFDSSLSSTSLPMETMLRYISEVPGKRLRPITVFLVARLFGDVNEITMHTALFVEMLHSATLIHDDIVDGSEERRGRPAVHAKWDNPSAVLAGDFLLAKAMLQLSENNCLPILKEMLDTTLTMSEGEMLENRRRKTEHGGQKTESEYLKLITRKTAMLFRSCCVGGALSVMDEKTEDRKQKLELAGDWGLNLGLVFQMRDDIMDADDAEDVAIAKKLLSTYLDKTLTSLDALTPMAKNKDALDSLRDLVYFCAERNQ